MSKIHTFKKVQGHALIAFGDAETEEAINLIMQRHGEDDMVTFEEQLAVAVFTHLLEHPEFMQQAWEAYLECLDQIEADA